MSRVQASKEENRWEKGRTTELRPTIVWGEKMFKCIFDVTNKLEYIHDEHEPDLVSSSCAPSILPSLFACRTIDLGTLCSEQ